MMTMAAAATLYVCTTCKGVGEFDPEAPRPGAVLLAALAAGGAPEGVTIKGVECLSACNTGCSIALSSPGKWTYVYGRLDPEIHAEAILAGTTLYAASTDGVVPWRERPEVFRKQSIARIPPLEAPDV
jgi:predicted metal-binding protein